VLILASFAAFFFAPGARIFFKFILYLGVEMKNIQSKKSTDVSNRPDLSFMADSWPSAIVSRTEIHKFTGGGYRSGTMANLDSKGEGPDGSFRLNRQVVYPVASLIEWLERRSTVIGKKKA